jgi:hypothetical protein
LPLVRMLFLKASHKKHLNPQRIKVTCMTANLLLTRPVLPCTVSKFPIDSL